MAAASAMGRTSSETTSEEQVITQEPKEANSTTAQKKSKQRKRGRRGPRRCHANCRGESFATYFRLVLKQVHQGLSLSREAVSVMDSMVHDILDRIGSEAGRLAHSVKHVTMTAWEIQIAVRLLLPGEMRRLAESEGTKAVLRYTRSKRATSGAPEHQGKTSGSSREDPSGDCWRPVMKIVEEKCSPRWETKKHHHEISRNEIPLQEADK
ncbi:Histone H2B type W-T, partial [Saguinus oedipus]